MTPSEVLGVAKDATPEQIKSAYRKLAMKHHPDKGGDISEFQKIQEAYDTLTKPKQNNDPNLHGNPFAGFEWAFSQGGFRPQKPKNSDYQTQAPISLEDAYNGTTLSITLSADKIITVKVPKGVQHGQVLIVEGEGSSERANLPPGNLQVIILIRPHSVFQFSGTDLLTVKDIDAIDLMIGCEIDLTAISGEKLTVTVPAGSSQRTRLRLNGKGMPIGETDHGALFIQINPVFPVLTGDQIEKLKAIKNNA